MININLSKISIEEMNKYTLVIHLTSCWLLGEDRVVEYFETNKFMYKLASLSTNELKKILSDILT